MKRPPSRRVPRPRQLPTVERETPPHSALHAPHVLDLLVLAPHPDDAEIGAGGLLARLAREGWRVGVVDMTGAQWGTKGDPDTRMSEAAEAGRVLGLAARECLGLGDAQLEASLPNRRIVAECLRRLRPRVLLAPLEDDPHPDHRAAHHLARGASLWARLPRAEIAGEPWSVQTLGFYPLHMDRTGRPSLLVDISAVLETKLEAMACFSSQFVNPALPEGYRYLATGDYLALARANAAHYGQLARVAAAEAFWLDRPPLAADPLGIFLAS